MGVVLLRAASRTGCPRARRRRAGAGPGRLRARGPRGRGCRRRRPDRAGRRGRWPRAERPRLTAADRRGAAGGVVPLVAAGGIADPASARAALVAGAAAVAMGTRFVASDECDAHPRYKASLLEAEGRDTVLTELFDVGWPAPHRVLRNSTYERWEADGRPPSGRRPGEGEEVAPGIPRYAVNMPLAGVEGDVEAMAMYAGQGVGASRPWSRPRRSSSASPPRCDLNSSRVRGDRRIRRLFTRRSGPISAAIAITVEERQGWLPSRPRLLPKSRRRTCQMVMPQASSRHDCAEWRVGGLMFASCLTWSTRSAKRSMLVLRSCGRSREKRATYNARSTH